MLASQPPLRIVSLISSATEMLYLLGLGTQVAGVSHECDFPHDVSLKPRLTRSLVDAGASSQAIDDQVRALAASQSALYAIDVEQLTGLSPDLIITQAQCDVCAVRYEDVVAAVRTTPTLAGAKILALNPASLADVLQDIGRVAAAAGAPDAGTRVVGHLQARIDAVVQGSERIDTADRPRVACLEWIEPPMLAGNWMPELMAMAGGRTALTTARAHSTYASWDEIVRFDPQVVIVMPCGFDLPRTLREAAVLPTFAGWQELSAVREGRVFAVDGNAYFNRSGPRMVDSLELLSHLFHPRRFAAPPQLAGSAWQRI